MKKLAIGILKGMGFDVHGEKLTTLGRIDLIIEIPKITYEVELKLDIAYRQVEQKRSHAQELRKGKEVAILGVSLSSKLRNSKARKELFTLH